jgi:hypothetical protein
VQEVVHERASRFANDGFGISVGAHDTQLVPDIGYLAKDDAHRSQE